MMDGYAVHAADISHGAALRVAGSVAAGEPADLVAPRGTCVAIATGAPVPEGLDAVIPHELSDRADPVRFSIDAIGAGHAIHPRGADARLGDLVMAPGRALLPHHLGIAAAVGATRLTVTRKPRLAILTSGDEVRPPDSAVAPYQIRNSNGIMLADIAVRFGGVVGWRRHLPDRPEPTIEAMREAVREFDLVLTVGGVSAGERDCFPRGYDAVGASPHLEGAAIQPGRPIQAWRTQEGCVILGLPGNPVSVLATAHLFFWPILRRMLGLDPRLPWEPRPLAAPVKPNAKRQAFRPATLNPDGAIAVPPWAGSGDLVHTSGTHGLAQLPLQAEDVAAGTTVPFLPWA
jgi:molybdopterin molybdotransferase